MNIICDAPHRHGLDCSCALKLLAAGAVTPEMAKWATNYQSHKGRRFSTSSHYDEVCDICGARDFTPGEDELAKFSCDEFQKMRSKRDEADSRGYSEGDLSSPMAAEKSPNCS